MSAPIAAIATAPGEGGVAIVRVSGDGAESILLRAFKPAARVKALRSHRMYFGWLIDEDGETLDEVMAVLMRAPKSYTREDVAEIQCHGGRAAARRALPSPTFVPASAPRSSTCAPTRTRT